MSVPRVTTFGWVPEFARGLVRDMRVRWALEETGQRYEVRLIDFPTAKADAHRALQPFGQVPTYQDDRVALFESGAIALHIANRWPGLMPGGEEARLHETQWVIAALNSVEPWVMALVINNVFEADSEWSKTREPKVRADLKARLDDLSHALGDRPWFGGEGFGVGDLMMVSVLRGLRGLDVLEQHPALGRYVARGEARPAFGKALADHMAVFAEAAE